MSRYNAQHLTNRTAVSYGFDHATGYFYQEFDSFDRCLVDLDSLFSGLTGVDLATRLESTTASTEHIQKAYLDLK